MEEPLIIRRDEYMFESGMKICLVGLIVVVLCSIAALYRHINPLADEIYSIKSVDDIISCAKAMINEHVKITFDPTLVRGMGYYTGTIFEISIDGYNFSIAGGGRYDKMIGKFCGQDVSACGFSIGFERIITILKDKLEKVTPVSEKNLAILIGKNVPLDRKLEIFKRAKALRAEGTTVTIQPMRKNMKQQIEKLEAEGFKEFEKVYND